MKVERIVPGAGLSPDLVGAVIVRDLIVGGERWPKGRRLSADDLATLGRAAGAGGDGADAASPGADATLGAVTVVRLGPGDVHEDEAALRLASAVAGSGLTLRGPSESRVDLVASAAGIAHVKAAAVERLDRVDPLEVFTILHGQAVQPGDLVASVKIGPHFVAATTLEAGLAIANRSRPLVRVAPFVPRRVGVVVKQQVREIARDRFEASVRSKVESLGSTLLEFDYVDDDPAAVERAFEPLVAGDRRADIVLTAGGASTDPSDAFFQAIESCGGTVVRHGVPAHPGSMVWLARIGRTDLLGLPTCGAYSKATAVDLILPRLLTGERASSSMAAALGHGGVLNRSMRFRFPPYARDLDAPEG